MGEYFIKDGYVPRLDPMYFVDDVEAVRGVRYQPDVYVMAETLAEAGLWCDSFVSIVDVGCGHADKLASMHDRHPDWGFVGVDIGANIVWCRQNFDWGRWHEVDLENESPDYEEIEPAIIIASDVIEHLIHPERLLRAIPRGVTVVLSTPERNLCWGPDHMGPSPNYCHVREWSLHEFKGFVNSEGFDGWFGLTRSSDESYDCRTILAVVTR